MGKAKTILILTKNNALTSALSYFTTLAIAKQLGPDIFGVYSYVVIMSSIGMILAIFGTDQACAKLHSKIRSVKRVFTIVHSIRLIFVFLTVAISVAVGDFTRSEQYYIAAMLIPNMGFGYIYEIINRNIKFSYIQTIEKLLYLGIICASLSIGGLTLNLLFGVMFVTSILSICYQIYDLKENIFPIGNINIIDTIPEIYSNLPLVAISLLSFVYGGINRLFLETDLGKGVLGIYSAGWQVIMIATVYQAQISRLWRLELTKAVVSENRSDLISSVRTFLIFSTVPLGFFGYLISANASSIVDFALGPKYSDLKEIIPIFAIYFPVISVASLIDIVWIALGRTYIFFLLQFMCSGLLFGFLLMNSKYMKINDFALVTVTAHFLSTLLLSMVWFYLYRNKVDSLVS